MHAQPKQTIHDIEAERDLANQSQTDRNKSAGGNRRRARGNRGEKVKPIFS